MQGRREEAEVIVRLDQQDQKVHICVSAWPAMYRKMCKLYGPSLDGADPKHSARWKLPLKIVSFRRLSALTTPRRLPTGGFKRTVKRQFDDPTSPG